jgi:hypothetical protein
MGCVSVICLEEVRDAVGSTSLLADGTGNDGMCSVLVRLRMRACYCG